MVTPDTLLHIGEDSSSVTQADAEPTSQLILHIGSAKTGREHFRHDPPTEAEIENAIQVVEDEVMRAVKFVARPSTLVSNDSVLVEVATWLGVSNDVEMTLSLQQVENGFSRLAARSMGRPSSQDDMPTNPMFAATLLILREFMHHLQFESIRITRG